MSVEVTNYSPGQLDVSETFLSLGFKTLGLTSTSVEEELTVFTSPDYDTAQVLSPFNRHQYIGDFEALPEKPLEYISLSFTQGFFRRNWENCGQLADLLAKFFAPLCAAQAGTEADSADLLVNENRHAISFIANELIENALKFHNNPLLPMSLNVRLYPGQVVVIVSNNLALQAAMSFKEHLVELVASDPGEMLIQKMEENALDLDGVSSGLGILTILSDYQTKAGWKFEVDSSQHDLVKVYSMVQLRLNEEVGYEGNSY